MPGTEKTLHNNVLNERMNVRNHVCASRSWCHWNAYCKLTKKVVLFSKAGEEAEAGGSEVTC